MPSAPAASGCDEDTGEVRPVKLPLARRDFLKGSGLLFGTLATGSGNVRKESLYSESGTLGRAACPRWYTVPAAQ